METLQFKFEGGMADNHELNFYEAGRFQYGAARFIYTLEKFRQEGKVVSKLTQKINADIRIRASEEGSFLQEVVIVSLPLVTQCALNCSFEAMFAYAWNLLLPPSKAKDVALEIAKIELERDKEKTKQSTETTKQLQAMADVVQSTSATNKQALDILNYAVQHGTTVSNDEYRLSKEDMRAIRDEAQVNYEREDILKQNETSFSQIKPETERLLASQLRKSVVDLSLPLRSSATDLRISSSDGKNKKVAYLNPSSAKSITSEKEDDKMTTIRGSIKSYDVETGYGKFRYEELKRPITFRVPSAVKEELKEKVLDAMKKDDVLVEIYFIRDNYKNPVSLILHKIRDDEALDNLRLT